MHSSHRLSDPSVCCLLSFCNILLVSFMLQIASRMIPRDSSPNFINSLRRARLVAYRDKNYLHNCLVGGSQSRQDLRDSGISEYVCRWIWLRNRCVFDIKKNTQNYFHRKVLAESLRFRLNSHALHAKKGNIQSKMAGFAFCYMVDLCTIPICKSCLKICGSTRTANCQLRNDWMGNATHVDWDPKWGWKSLFVFLINLNITF